MGNVQSIPTWLDTPPLGEVSPPTHTRKQNLPIKELSWESFERLCLQLARREVDVESCRLYGVQGDKQGGIDIFARDGHSTKYKVYQCKRVKNFGAAKIKAAIDDFLTGEWKAKSDMLVLCTQESLQSQQRSDAFEEQFGLLKQDGITLVAWDSHHFSLELKKNQHHDLVDDFFGREWVRQFCGEQVADGFKNRLSGAQVTEFRERLGKFYSRVFNNLDPGLPYGELSEQSALPIEKRFVYPDVIEERSVSFSKSTPLPDHTPTDDDFRRYFDPQPTRIGTRHEELAKSKTIAERVTIDNWLATTTTAIVLGDPGSGKSSLLRFLAIDLLRQEPQMENACRRWGRHLPVWLPFHLWTKAIARQPDDSSLSEVLRSWLRSFNEERLWPLLEKAINDDRLLLLVDGLDEWESEESASIALSRLQVFVENRGVPMVASSRPRAFRKLGLPTHKWQVVNLADFSDDQQRQLARTWFARSNHRPDAHRDEGTPDSLAFEVDGFMAELKRSRDLSELAKNPLLLLLLIYHRMQRSTLPAGRFKAYESIVDHLVATHPSRRRVAASVAGSESELNNDEVSRALAFLAFHLQCHETSGVINQKDAADVVEEFMSDPEHGLGVTRQAAKRLCQKLIDIGEGSLGLIVQRSNDEIGFFHRTLQEYLAAFQLSDMALEKQSAVIEEHAEDPQWHETIVCLFHLTRRSQDLLTFADVLERRYTTATPTGKLEIEAILAELAFGAFRISPERARTIAESTFLQIERGDWMPQRERLLRITVEGCRSTTNKLRVKEKITQWFPCRTRWRGDIYEAMSNWPLTDELLNCLWNGVHDGNILNQRPAAKALCHQASGDPRIGNEFARLATKHPLAIVRAVALEALIGFWPNHGDFGKAISSSRRSLSPELRLLSIHGRFSQRQNSDEDEIELIALASQGSGLHEFDDVLIDLMAGWPKKEHIRAACLKGLKDRYVPEVVAEKIAMPVLLKGFSDDPDFVTIVAEKLRDEERPFIGLYFDNIWASLPASFAGNSEVIDAADEWIERQDLNGPEIYHAAKLTRTERSKRKLLSLLDDSFAFWSAAALLETWGSGDSEVNSRLNSIAIGDNIKAATIAHLLPRILLNPEACRKRLTELLHDSTVRRPDFVLQGLIDLDAIDEQVVQFVVENVLTRKDVWVGDLASTKSRLIRAFPEHPLVKEIALQALSSRVSDMEAPSVGCIAKAYRGDRDIHNRIFEMASPLPKHLRAHVIGQLRSTFLGDQFALDLFAKYDLEENADLKCEASLAYHERVKSSGTNLDSALASLAADICCYGMDHEERRQAAFCGLVTLQRLDLMRAAREGNGGSSPCAISLHSSLAFGPNVPLVNLILEKWDEIRRTLGEDFWKRLSKFSGNPWQYLWDFADQNTQCSAEGIEFIESLPTKNLEIAALRFVGRARPRSQLLMQCCFETLQIDDDRVDMSGDRAITAAEILGSHFHGNGLVLERVLTGREDNHLYNKKLLVLYEAFPAHEALRQAYDAFRRDYRPFNGEMQIRLICQFGTTDEVADMISNLCVRQARPFVPPLFFVNPIARRMSSDSELLDKLLNRLKSSPSPSEKASLSRLLPASVAHASGLRDWAQLELLSQVNEPEIGLDILSGELRPVSHAILDGILPF